MFVPRFNGLWLKDGFTQVFCFIEFRSFTFSLMFFPSISSRCFGLLLCSSCGPMRIMRELFHLLKSTIIFLCLLISTIVSSIRDWYKVLDRYMNKVQGTQAVLE
uniref:Uncharacterized protein n=1 Tax=Cacopsylla melanoneura TaxID=428564 RepID=A0A8D8LEV5_9HEMI